MQDFFYCSEEVASRDLPVACTLVRYLAVQQMQNKAAVIETAHPIYRSRESKFVALAKGGDSVSEVFAGKVVAVFLLPYDDRAGTAELDVKAGLQPVQDWGALVLTREAAERWQAT